MGLSTTRYKTVAWCVAAVFLGLAGGPTANLIGFIDPIQLAFAGATYGVWMILMAILGGRGTLWGPVIGAVRSEEHTSELQSLMRISYAVFCLKKKKKRYQSSK